MIVVQINFEALCLLLLVANIKPIMKLFKVVLANAKRFKQAFTAWARLRPKEGQPTRCPQCGSRDLVRGEYITEEPYGIIEYDVICNTCKAKVATWRYGGWEYD